MAKSDRVDLFIRDALLAGRSRSEIAAALASAGWSQKEITAGLSTYVDVSFQPPVPRPVPQLTARDAFLYLTLFSALSITAIYLINLCHSMLDIWMPDVLDGSYLASYANKRVLWALAVLIVSTPVYIGMTLRTDQEVARDPGQLRSPVRRWLTYMTLFLSALAFLSAGSYSIYELLSGEMTLRFVLKAITVAIVSFAVFAFYWRYAEEGKHA